MATVLPSYFAGAAVVVLVFFLGKLWRGPGVGLAAAILTGFNRALLVQMQQATPTTLGLAGALLAILAYGRSLQAIDGKRVAWAVTGGLGLGLSLLSVGAFGLLVMPIILLHRASLATADPLGGKGRATPWKWWRDHPTLVDGALALAIGLAIAGPWHAMMVARYGRGFLAALMAPPQATGPTLGLTARMIDLAPAILPLGLFAAARALRRLLTAESDDRMTVGGALCLAWLAVAALAPAVLARGPRPALNLFLLFPLNLFAASAMVDLSGRRIPARALCWLAPATATTLAWWSSTHLRQAASDLLELRSPAPDSALGMHLALDLVVVLVIAVRGLDRWARRRDDRRLIVLAGFLGAVLAATVASGLREVRFRHRETTDLLALRDAILRREAAKPFEVLAVIGPALGGEGLEFRPAGRLRFLLRASLPRVSQVDLTRVEDLRTLPAGQRLVVLSGVGGRLDYATQSRLNLESINPGRSGVMEAFATRSDGGREARR